MDSNNFDQSKNGEDLSFQVMPKGSGPLTNPPSEEPKEAPTPNPVFSQETGIPKTPHPIDNGMLPMEPEPSRFRSKILYLIIGLVVLTGLGIAAYLLLGGNADENEPAVSSNLPKVWLLKNFGSETCADNSKCGEQADPDNDGLPNLNEFRYPGLNPTAPDTDGDGLADGDEVQVFKTNPTLKYSDTREIAIKNNYNDGSQISNDYDPLTPGLKMTATRKDQIMRDTGTYPIHEPTITTLKKSATQSTSSTNPQSFSVHIQATSFNPSTISINKDDTIIWLNDDVMSHQIASDPHPSHSDLPDLTSGSLSKNQTYSYKFTKTGTFKYHDHLNPALKGTVEVK